MSIKYENEILFVANLLKNEKWMVIGGYNLYLSKISHDPADIDIILSKNGLDSLMNNLNSFTKNSGENWRGIEFYLNNVKFEAFTEEGLTPQFYQFYLDNENIKINKVNNFEIPCLELVKQLVGYCNVAKSGNGTENPRQKISKIILYLLTDSSGKIRRSRRNSLVCSLRSSKLTFNEIGILLNVSRARAQQIYKKYKFTFY